MTHQSCKIGCMCILVPKSDHICACVHTCMYVCTYTYVHAVQIIYVYSLLIKASCVKQCKVVISMKLPHAIYGYSYIYLHIFWFSSLRQSVSTSQHAYDIHDDLGKLFVMKWFLVIV